MGNNNSSIMERVYLVLPALMFHSKLDYNDGSTLFNIRLAYYGELSLVFMFLAYFILAVKQRHDTRKILVPHVPGEKLLLNTPPPPEQIKYRYTNYFEHEIIQCVQHIQQYLIAMVITTVLDFGLGFRLVLLLQIFATPYNFADNKLFRKHVVGLKPGQRVWGEAFAGEIPEGQILHEEGDERLDSDLVEDKKREKVEIVAMPSDIEHVLVDAWDNGSSGDWAAVAGKLGPFSVNSQTPEAGWSPLMVACGLPQVTTDELKTLLEMGADPFLADEDGWTCLHWAAQQGRAEAIQEVLMTTTTVRKSEGVSAELKAMEDSKSHTAAQVARGAKLSPGALSAVLRAL
ncbi:unnamed protein product, partial [Discosporangium mesarthrocarpum]